MCNSLCKVPKLKIDGSEWHTKKVSKPSKCHWVVLFVVLCAFTVWMARDINGMITGIEFTGTKENSQPAIEISGVDFVSEEIKAKHQALATSMRYHGNLLSEDVLFGFQFALNDRIVDDHIFFLPDAKRVFGNAKIIERSEAQIKCTEEYNGELRQVVRNKEVRIKAIDIEEWKQVEYLSTHPKEACTIQHAIDILELKWV